MSNSEDYIVFPGQGSQVPGMGAKLYETYPEAREIFDRTDEALSFSLTSVMFGQDDNKLRRTAFAQPALLALSAAIFSVMQNRGSIGVDAFRCVAGHSLGEYSALYAAGVLQFEDAVRLVHLRGKAMQSAVPVGQGGMVSVMGTDIDTLEDLVAKASEMSGDGIISIANDNAQGQIVVAGETSAIESLITLCKADKRKTIPLAVSAPFHSIMMKPAEELMKVALSDVPMSDAAVPVICNATARPYTSADELRANLIAQVCGRVRWRESMLLIADRYEVNTQIECGSRKVLTGLIKRIAPHIKRCSLDEPNDIEEWVASKN